MADRFFADQSLATGDVRLHGSEAHHMIHVRRFAPGDRVALFNGDGKEYLAEVIDAGKKEVLLRIDRMEEPSREIQGTLHIGSALPKGDRADFLIEKLTELGVTDFTPLLTARAVVQPKPQAVEKFQRAVIEASKQCGRNMLMRVHSPQKFERWLESVTAETKWILHPGGRQAGIGWNESLAVAVGPEGGFTEEEVAKATAIGFANVSLGPRILRVETAAIAIAALASLPQ